MPFVLQRFTEQLYDEMFKFETRANEKRLYKNEVDKCKTTFSSFFDLVITGSF